MDAGDFVFVIVDAGDHGGKDFAFRMFQGGMEAQDGRKRIKLYTAIAEI